MVLVQDSAPFHVALLISYRHILFFIDRQHESVSAA
jgi:hypothetical protein